MKLKFIADLDYQKRAIDSVVQIFKGQEMSQSNFTVSYGPNVGMIQTDLGVGNRLDLTLEEILKNVQDIQMKNGLPRSERLDGMHFTVEMETQVRGRHMSIYGRFTNCINITDLRNLSLSFRPWRFAKGCTSRCKLRETISMNCMTIRQ